MGPSSSDHARPPALPASFGLQSDEREGLAANGLQLPASIYLPYLEVPRGTKRYHSAINAFIFVYELSSTNPREAVLIRDFCSARDAYLRCAKTLLDTAAYAILPSLYKVMSEHGYEKNPKKRRSQRADLCLCQALSATSVSTRPSFPFNVESANRVRGPRPPLISSSPIVVVGLPDCPWTDHRRRMI